MDNITNRPLSEIIQKFKDDTLLAHEFVNGNETTMVHGEGGSYPSLAKIAADTRSLIVELYNSQTQGLAVKHYRFESTMDLIIEHNLATHIFDLIIINTEGLRVHAPIDPIDENKFKVCFTEPEAGTVTVNFFTPSIQ